MPVRRAGTRRGPKARSTLRGVVETLAWVAFAVVVALLVQAFLLKPYKIPSGSMENTLAIGQRVLALRVLWSPQVGEIVVFHPPQGALNDACGAPVSSGTPCDQPTRGEASTTFIKRIVGGPGDRLRIVDGHVIRNGVREHDPYALPCVAAPGLLCNSTRTITVPPGHWFMMGDNRGNSDDSRVWGPVPRSWMIGKAVFTYWPPGRIGTL